VKVEPTAEAVSITSFKKESSSMNSSFKKKCLDVLSCRMKPEQASVLGEEGPCPRLPAPPMEGSSPPRAAPSTPQKTIKKTTRLTKPKQASVQCEEEACSRLPAPPMKDGSPLRDAPNTPQKTIQNISIPPPHWEEVLAGIKAMRAKYSAPVDTMGCDVG
jgi:hypothetical protein